jgi:tetratricopeptide (TPR) repeat protein
MRAKARLSSSLASYDEAVKAYDKAIELSPQLGLLKADAWQGKGNSLKALGRQADADAAFAKAKELAEAAIAKAKELGFTG